MNAGAGMLTRLYRRLLDRAWPPCPQGGHRVRNALVTSYDGQVYCWHPDCQYAVLRANRDCPHVWARFDGSNDGMVSFERCVACAAHRIV